MADMPAASIPPVPIWSENLSGEWITGTEADISIWVSPILFYCSHNMGH
jgi:hypothetical protein